MKAFTKNDIIQEVKQATEAHRVNPSHGSSKMALGVAQVVEIYEEEHSVVLKILTGQQDQYHRAAVPMSYPGVGARHFFGAMPEVGDRCVVGYMLQDSSGGTMTPVVLSWLGSAAWLGRDWLPTQPFSPDEYDFDPAGAARLEGVYQRIRHKRRHMLPGDILASSSKGSDIHLNESVLITNRRGNEIRLRDQDQALITRSLQSFNLTSGVRIYNGAVQRDAQLLNPSVISDGIFWDSGKQISEGLPLSEYDLASNEIAEAGVLLPSHIFFRPIGEDTAPSGIRVSNVNTDPYNFLRRGLFIDEDGRVIDPDSRQSNTIYGGKSFYRIGTRNLPDGTPMNGAASFGMDGQSLTEYRVEIQHDSDGTLPVSEQTDGFDADRLPAQDGDMSDGGKTKEPYIEIVHGTVVGNFPYSVEGSNLYGLPLKISTIDSDGNPLLKTESAIGYNIGEQAATLFKLNPPQPNLGMPTIFSVQKNGKVNAYIGGAGSDIFSLDLGTSRGVRLAAAGEINISANKGLTLKSTGANSKNEGIKIESTSGAISILAGGKTSVGRSSKQGPRQGDGESGQPAFQVDAKGDILFKSTRKIRFQGSGYQFDNTDSTKIKTNALTEISSGEKVRITAKTIDQTCFGKATQTYSGPLDFLPTNIPIRTQQFIANPATGHFGGPTDDYLMLLGDRTENILLGNHTTRVLVGTATYEVVGGLNTQRAGLNQTSIDPGSGINSVATLGNISHTAPAGAFIVTAGVAAKISSLGSAILSGGAGVDLGGPGKIGGIVCSTDLDPLTGLPLGTFLMGSPGHRLIVPV